MKFRPHTYTRAHQHLPPLIGDNELYLHHMRHIFGKKVMTTLVSFICAGHLVALKRLCEWLLEISAYFNNRLIFLIL